MSDSYRLVSVKWLDANAESGWGKATAITGPQQCMSIGWLVRDEEKWIALAGTIGGEEVNQTISIPRDWIGELVDITPTEVKEKKKG